MKRVKANTRVIRSLSNVTGQHETRYIDTRTGEERNRWWTKARTPGTIRPSRLPGGSGDRNNWEGTPPKQDWKW